MHFRDKYSLKYLVIICQSDLNDKVLKLDRNSDEDLADKICNKLSDEIIKKLGAKFTDEINEKLDNKFNEKIEVFLTKQEKIEEMLRNINP